MIQLPKNLHASRFPFSIRGISPAVVCLLVFLLIQPTYLVEAAKKKSSVKPNEPATVEAWRTIINRAATNQGEKWSAFVKDLRTGEIIFSHNQNDRLIPASNRKLAVFAMAMDKLGPEFQFRTELGYTGALDPATGAVSGSLVLRSNGDPTMDSRYLSDRNPASVLRGWISGLKQAGIKRFDGDCIIDASAFGVDQDMYPEAWDESYRFHSYANPPSAIPLAENLLRVSVKPSTTAGRPGRVSLFPSGDGLKLDNRTSSSSGKVYGLDGRFTEDGRTLTLIGRLGMNVKTHVISIPHPKPNLYVEGVVREALRNEGIAIGGTTRIVTDRALAREFDSMTVAAWHESIPLIDLMRIMMVNSDNFIAEQIWRGAAFRATGDGSIASTRRLEQTWLAENGLPWVEPGFDGSGLSRKNQISAMEMVAILESVYSSPYQQYLLNCLPVSGRSGTLRGRSMGHEPGRVVAKTGTLSGVMGLSGFIRDEAGAPRWAFALFGNARADTNGRLNLRANQIMKVLIGMLDRGYRPGAVTAPVVSIKKYKPGTKQYVGSAS